MRILAIGDIHGCSVAWDTLLSVMEPQADDLIITLGDYVNRGPDSNGVLASSRRSPTSDPLFAAWDELR